MIDFVCFKWKPGFDYRSKFEAAHVNTLYRMIARNITVPFTLHCITDDAEGIGGHIITHDLSVWDERGFSDVPSPHAGNNPSCYRRLRLWDASAAGIIGPRICSIDLDCVIIDDITPLVDRAEPCVMWGDYVNPHTHFNGSMQLITPGLYSGVYNTFDPLTTPNETRRNGFHGSDQGWLSLFHERNEFEGVGRWTAEDGVLSYRVHCRKALNVQKLDNVALPDGARIVFFHGPHDPWLPETQREAPWIKDYYR